MKRSEIEAAARDYIDVVWRHRGRQPHAIDCVGLLMQVGDRFGVSYEDMDGYSRLANGERLVNHLKRFLPVASLPLKPAQVVVVRDGRHPCHVGILASPPPGGKGLRIVHSSATHGRVLEEDFAKWMPRFRIALDWPGIEEG